MLKLQWQLTLSYMSVYPLCIVEWSYLVALLQFLFKIIPLLEVPTRSGLMFLNFRMNCQNWGNNTKDQIKADKELVCVAFTRCCTLDSMGKVDVKAHNSCHRSDIHQEREEEKQCRPYLRTSLFHVFNPGTVPRMSKVHKQNQLNQDKQEGTDETKIHPHCKVIIREGNVNTRLF